MTDIDRIRRLLADFYLGMTTPDEEQEIARFFRENSTVPKDLEPDRKLFEGLDSGAEPPDGLLSDIETMLDRKVSALRLRWRIGGAMAAAAVVGIMFSICYRTDSTLPSVKPVAVRDLVAFGSPEPQTADSTVAITVTEQTVTQRPVKPCKVRRLSSRPYREITDPEQAIAQAEKALGKIRVSLEPMHQANAMIEKKIENINETINRITE